MSELVYDKKFDTGAKLPAAGESVAYDVPVPERRDGDGDTAGGKDVYVYDETIELMVNVALATGRPLLVRGDPGCGKSALAASVARRLGWRYYEEVITSRTTARDLQWRFDAIRRLADAQGSAAQQRRAARPELYVEPGVLWWTYEPETAPRRGATRKLAEKDQAKNPGLVAGRDAQRSVVLIDEIDKAEPDVPNDLLEALGTRSFTVIETGKTVRATERPPLILITSNGERQLPAAFLRRCVTLEVRMPEDLTAIGARHFPKAGNDLLDDIQKLHRDLVDAAEENDRRPPSIAEYLDAVRACLELRDGDDLSWREVAKATLEKAPALSDEGSDGDDADDGD